MKKALNFSLLSLSFIFVGIAFANALVPEKQPQVKKSESHKQKSLEKELKNKKIDISKHKLSAQEVAKIKKQAGQTKKVWQKRSIKSTSLATTKRLMRAQKHLVAKNYKRAIEILDRVIKRSSTSKYERAKALVTQAQAYLSLKKYAPAESALLKALKIKKLSYRESVDALLMLAQGQLLTKNYKQAKINLLKYIEIASNESGSARMMLASVNYELKENKAALKNIELAINSTKKPQESWLYFASAIYVRNKKFSKAQKLLERLVKKRQDNKGYWMSLIAVLIEQDKNKEALKNLELAQKLGYIKTSGEILNRSSLLLSEKIPYKAAQVLATAIANDKIKSNAQNYETLASFWFVAKEFDKAISAYQKASSYSNTGEIQLMLGQVYLEKEDWKLAETSFKKALQKGRLKDKQGNAYIGLGMSSFFQNNKTSAIHYFSKATSYKRQKTAANRWLSYLN